MMRWIVPGDIHFIQAFRKCQLAVFFLWNLTDPELQHEGSIPMGFENPKFDGLVKSQKLFSVEL
jgi:hypothetical protein